MKPWNRIKTCFALRSGNKEVGPSIRQFLESECVALANSEAPLTKKAFLERLESFLHSPDPTVQRATIQWALADLAKNRKLPRELRPDVYRFARCFNAPWVADSLVECLNAPGTMDPADLVAWLAEIDYVSPRERQHIINGLFQGYLASRQMEPAIVSALAKLDEGAGEVTDLVLHQFPAKTLEENTRIIQLLGMIGRYRVIKPLISFCQEYPEYLRVVMKALSEFEFDEVDQFYINCLSPLHRDNPVILIEAVKQVRRRRLRKATPLLDDLFPLESNQAPLVSRAVNGEVAVTMASFGAYVWAREKLLTEIMLNGMTRKYLKAIDILNLEEAVPLLKAILLMPETPELMGLQHYAYHVCDRLLTNSVAVSKSLLSN